MIKKLILQKNLQWLFQQATIGIEKEGQRVLENGQITTTRHPKAFGSRAYHPYIQTDFAESQIELITPVVQSETEAFNYLSAIHEVTLRQMADDEWIWPLSMPAILPDENDILEAQINQEEIAYRQYLSIKYGKYKQMISGIHYNFGLSKEFFEAIKEDGQSLVSVQNDIYMKLARQFIRYQWLLVYWFGASPIVDKKYYREDILNKPVRSIRASHYGYVNDKHVSVSFESLDDYIQTLSSLVETKTLISEKEFYSSIRFRGSKSIKNFTTNGIQYVELRLFDLNPFALYGITEKDIRFIHLFILLMIWLEEENSKTSVDIGKQYSEHIALSHPLDLPQYQEEGQWLCQQLLTMAKDCHFSQEDIALIEEKKQQLNQPSLTIGGQLWLLYEQTTSIETVGMLLAKIYKKHATDKPFGLNGFANMELSTQAFLSDIIQYGIHVDILDASDQFLKLTYQNQVEYVKNGNMTSKDTYISPLIMENKVVTKKVLAQAGFCVPDSIQCTNVQEAIQLFSLVKNKPIVIKPKSTNYGLGISIFQHGTDNITDFTTAIEIALKEDTQVMIESFISGTEYRFFVINNETKAVLKRVPAHIIGDGVHTVKQLVYQKNESNLRGDGKTTPLKKIELGDIEILQLKEQGYTIDSIVPKDVVVYLRVNSNISTGGDSVDMTDNVHHSYKQIAVDITQTLQASVCGVDLIIPDITIPANSKKDSYSIIEANFNPMMMMHIFPEVGQSRRLTTDVLKMLYPTLEVVDSN